MRDFATARLYLPLEFPRGDADSGNYPMIASFGPCRFVADLLRPTALICCAC